MRQNSVALIVFFRDVGSDLQETLNGISVAVKHAKELDFELILVDDGSESETQFELDERLFFNFAMLKHPKSRGISEAIKAGLAISTAEWILPIPGHAMFGEVAITNILNLCGKGDIILGCRTNLARSRPPIKRLASRILRDLYRHLTFYYIGDIHGLFLARRKDFENYLPNAKGHGNAIAVITNSVANGGLLIQTATPVQEGHDNRSSKKLTDNLPSFSAIATAVSALRQARKTYRKSQLDKIDM